MCRITIAILAIGLVVASADAPVSANSPCGDFVDVPYPPIPPDEPDWTGVVVESASGATVSGATVDLYVCEGGEATLSSSTASANDGSYSLPILAPGHYFAQAHSAGQPGAPSGVETISGSVEVQLTVD